jgi:Na+-transporting NADH:ubiquinone oxidoreductase subunit NqrF
VLHQCLCDIILVVVVVVVVAVIVIIMLGKDSWVKTRLLRLQFEHIAAGLPEMRSLAESGILGFCCHPGLCYVCSISTKQLASNNQHNQPTHPLIANSCC